MTAETTRDALLGGRIPYEQPAHGYRVALEAPMIARFAIEGRSRPFAHVVDLGAGPGAVGLMLTATGWATRGTAVEVDPFHAELARRNAELNAVPLAVVHANVAAPPPLERGDLVISNPPWFETEEGGVAPEPSRAAARAFVHGALESFARTGARLLAPRGRMVITMPSSRTTELFEVLASVGLHPKRVRFVHPRPQREAQVVFVEAKPGKPGGLVIERPWFVRGREGQDYVPETADALMGRWPTITASSAAAAAGPAGRPSADRSEPDPA